MERSGHITKRALGLIPVLDTLAGSREKRIFNLFNHLSDDSILQFKIPIYFSPQNSQTLETFNVIAKRPTRV